MLALAGDPDRAGWETTELLVLNPGFSLSRLAYAFPFNDPRELDLLLEGLRRAGLPE